MPQGSEQIKKLAELNALFLSLNDKGQEGALTVLRSLELAQSVMEQAEHPPTPTKDHSV